jgi:glutaryl-CoA dehydrogenase
MAETTTRVAGTDYYQVDDLLTDAERAVRARVRDFCDSEVLPVINRYWEAAEFPHELVPKLAALGVCGGTIVGYGCPGLSAVAAGLVAQEICRGDGSLNTFFGVQSGLVMQSIYLLGSEEQRQRWLPRLASFDAVGAFALTEPRHGTDAVMLETRARRDGESYVIDGEKRWIGNATFADLVVVWARDAETGEVGGFLVEKGAPGLDARLIEGKTSQRAVHQAHIRLEGVRVPAANRLPGAGSFRDTTRVLSATRQGIAWEAVGHAMAAYEAALAYSKERSTFGKPIASYQLVQAKLVGMLAEITAMQLVALRLSQLLDAGKMTDGQASLAKMHNARKARQVCADARDLLGGNGILLDYHVARHQADLEATYTYEGTDSVQTLIVGREITGIQAFASR